jgi:hypothetical protein
LLGVYVTPTQHRSFGDVPALLVEEDLRCTIVHYFRHERVTKGFESTAVSGKYFEVNDLNHSATDAPKYILYM